MPLTADDVAHYRERGYVRVSGIFDAPMLARFDQRFRDLIEERAAVPASLLVVRDVMVVKGVVRADSPLQAVNKILNFEDDPVLFAYVVHPPLLDAVAALIGPGLMSIATNVFNKPPGVDGRHPLHQDLLYFPLRPPEKIVGAWTALEPATRENGCLCVIPGSHRGPLRRHADPEWEYVNKYFFSAEEVDLGARTHLPMERGDTLLFHPLLLHGSGHNASAGFRRAISAHYARRDCERLPGRGPMTTQFREV